MVIVQGPWSSGGGLPPRPAVERRAYSRARTLLTGKLTYGQGETQDCAVRNVSEGGANIRVASSGFAPDNLHLIVVRTGTAYAAKVVWRRGAMAGLTFSRSYDLNDPPAEAIALRRLWVELAPR